MAPRRLEGWEPREWTVYSRDEEGVVVGATTYREPEWSTEDVLALAAVVEKRAGIGSHGYPLEEAMSRDADPSNPDRKFDLHVPPPAVDFFHQKLDRVQRQYREKYPDADIGSLRWRVEKRER